VDVDRLLAMIDTDRDSAMLRLTLSRLLVAQGDADQARTHLEAAVGMDAGYTAAWKELGKLRLVLDDSEGAAAAWSRGIEEAQAGGDKQAEKEMTVFLKRLRKP
jgi:predicted negative regulator of RcsB-dependent stress response